MVLNIPLTNEKVCKKFKSQFDLVNYAIRLAENMIRTGRETRVKMESKNRALQILSEIIQGKDQFDEIPVVEPIDVEEVRFVRHEEGRNAAGTKSSERKKGRKILAS